MTNPFFEKSTLPYQLPPFAEIADEHYEEAFEKGMEEQLVEISAITRKRDFPMFENTFPALESSGQLLARVAHVFYNKSSADSTDFTNELEEKIAPKLAAHEDAIRLDSFLYSRVKTVYESLDAAEQEALTPEDRYLVERYYLEMTLAGAGLDEEQKVRLKELNQQLATLTTKFEKNLLADTNELAVHLTDAADLAGLEPGEISAAAEAAAARELDGYLVTLVLPTGHPFLEQLTDPGVRAKIMAASTGPRIARRRVRQHGYPSRDREASCRTRRTARASTTTRRTSRKTRPPAARMPWPRCSRSSRQPPRRTRKPSRPTSKPSPARR